MLVPSTLASLTTVTAILPRAAVIM